MHLIRLSQETFEKLERLARAFTDAPEDVVMRLVDAKISNLDNKNIGDAITSEEHLKMLR